MMHMNWPSSSTASMSQLAWEVVVSPGAGAIRVGRAIGSSLVGPGESAGSPARRAGDLGGDSSLGSGFRDPAFEEAAVGDGAGQRERLAVGGPGFGGAAETAEEFGPGRVPVLVSGQVQGRPRRPGRRPGRRLRRSPRPGSAGPRPNRSGRRARRRARRPAASRGAFPPGGRRSRPAGRTDRVRSAVLAGPGPAAHGPAGPWPRRSAASPTATGPGPAAAPGPGRRTWPRGARRAAASAPAGRAPQARPGAARPAPGRA